MLKTSWQKDILLSIACKWSLAGIVHVSVDWKGRPLFLLATARLDGRTTASFQWEGGPPHDRQKIQMGLHKGNTVLC